MSKARVVPLSELLELVDRRGLDACVVDLETNGLRPRDSVLSCSAIRYRVDAASRALVLVDAVARYYYPCEPLNPQATAVNGLSLDEITRRRANAAYPAYFRDDGEILASVSACDLVVAHNAGFDLGFLPSGAASLAFCTMRASTAAVQLRRAGGGFKAPTLHEAARHYRVDAVCARAHESLCDACVAAMVFERMLAGGRRRPRSRARPRPCECLQPGADGPAGLPSVL